jgi:glycosyltransferase involved in cell wall biosynthesis
MSTTRLIVNARFLNKRITGIERYALEESYELKEKYPDTIFVTHKGVIHEKEADELGVIEYGILTGHLWEQLELLLYCTRQNDAELLCLMNTGPIGYKNKKTVIHDLAFLRHPEWYSKRARIFFKLIVTNTIKTSKELIAVSDFTKNEILDLIGFEEDKIIVKNPKVSRKLIELSKNSYANKYGRYILTVGSLEPRKNLITLLKAFDEAKLEEVKLIIVGAENKRVFNSVNFKKYYGRDNILFLGYISDEELVSLYQNTELFVYPSLYEGYGLPVKEAELFTKNIISNNIPAISKYSADKNLEDAFNSRYLLKILKKNLN